MGLIHLAASAFSPPAGAPLRWQWDKEILISKADDLIPQDDLKAKEEFQEVMYECLKLEKSSSNYGIIHADHAPQNFRYDPGTTRVTAFDFGNCCYHWYLADLAISLSTVRRKKNREEIRYNVLEGYSEVRALPPNLNERIDLFIRLRVVYVYLSRLHLWSKNKSLEQAKELEGIKNRVHEKTGWG